jgi:serine/threonine-protein kinase
MAPTIRCRQCGEQLEVTARFCGACGAQLVDANIERVVGRRYLLKERIGAGSLGVVYRAEQQGLGRKLAIKLLQADAAADPTVVARFTREGELLCQLRSAHTVTTYEFDRDVDGSLYIAMELSSGKSLAEVFAREGPLDFRRVLRILAGLCDSLAEAHALGVIHRDLKPENILLEARPTNADFVKVLDFGLAKVLPANLALSPVGQTVGSIEFMSPEQLQGKPIDARSDLYALGVLGYLLVTGRHPFADARSYGDMIAAHVSRIPPPPSTVRPELSITTDVDMILARCLEKDPARRFPDAPALAAVIGVMLQVAAPAHANDTIRTPEGEEDTALAPIPTKDDRR